MLKKFALGSLAAVVVTVAASGTTTVRAQTKDVVETAVAAGSFKTLATALEAAGLDRTCLRPWRRRAGSAVQPLGRSGRRRPQVARRRYGS